MNSESEAISLGFLAELLALIDSFVKEGQPQKVPSFMTWLAQKSQDDSVTAPQHLNGYIWAAMSILTRASNHAAKATLAAEGLGSVYEFGLIASLAEKPGQSKSELIRSHQFEVSSGSDIISRLTRAGLLISKANPTDRRSQLLYLTDAGYALMNRLYVPMGQQVTTHLAVLSKAEKMQLLSLLERVMNHVVPPAKR